MPNITYDGQSFSIDGRRVWLVSGAIHYPRVPRELWRDRIRAAKQAGLNCIETYVFWNLHEPAPGEFDFEGDLDLRAFVQMIGEEGMFCYLRPGPYICAEWDFGGLPAWLHRLEVPKGKNSPGPLKLRQDHPQFLEATSRYLTAVMEQVGDLQVSNPPPSKPVKPAPGNVPGEVAGGYQHNAGGPILLMQAENEWFSHNDEQAEGYLHQIVRYLRENGCGVPISVCNQLWQEVAGTFHTWNASANLFADLRQLAVVQADAPRIVTEYWPGWFDHWGGQHADRVPPQRHYLRMAQILAAGAMPSMFMFHGGTNFGFMGGRTVCSPGCFMTTSYDYDAPLLEAGGRGPKYLLTKRICTFASHFASLFANLDPKQKHAAAAVTEREDQPVSVVQLTGGQGNVIFLMRGEGDKREQIDVLLTNGLTLPVPLLAGDTVTWVVTDAKLGGVVTLNYTNLSPFAFVTSTRPEGAAEHLLVLFGPGGATGLLALDDVPIEVKVPQIGVKEPVVERHDGGITLCVLNEEQVDAAYLCERGLVVGSSCINIDGGSEALKGWDEAVTVSPGGEVSREATEVMRKPAAPKLHDWERIGVEELVTGESERYEKIDGPTSLEGLGVDYGYGWYRIGIASNTKAGKMLAPNSGDRLHIYQKGQLETILGFGPGAESDPVHLNLKNDIVVLADNLGRFNYGTRVGEQKGLVDHLFDVKPIKLGKPTVSRERPADPFALSGFVMHRRKGDLPVSSALSWSVKPDHRKTLVLELTGELPGDVVVVVNEEPFAYFARNESGGLQRWTLEPGEGPVTGGQNEIKLCFFEELDDPQAVKGVTVYQVQASVTARGGWQFAKWDVPGEEADWQAVKRSHEEGPAWFRCVFNTSVDRMPLWLEPVGMSKGQIYFNGHNAGRYFVETHEGKKVPPQERYYLPQPWVNHSGPNELLLFDEHGRHPGKVHLAFDEMGPYDAW